jgi:hypothetical protein
MNNINIINHSNNGFRNGEEMEKVESNLISVKLNIFN